MDYDLTQLDHRKFEHLMQALAVEKVARGISAFGDGPDNGREATYEGTMDYPADAERWSGLLVMQAKFRQEAQAKAVDARWALKELRKELERIFAKGSKRTRPDYYIFATSVTLSSARDGGKDEAKAIAAKYPLKDFRLWDGDQIRTYLDTEDRVRDSFDALITSSDVLAELKRQLRHATPSFDRLIMRFLEKELLADQYANLEQAGKMIEEQIPISRVFVDLPVRSEDRDGPRSFLAAALEVAAERLNPDSEPRGEPGGPDDGQQRGRLVVVGGPGQGKTTAGQILCQLFRVTLLRSRPPGSLTQDAEAAMVLMESQCEKEGIELPAVPRFPVRIALTELADRLADDAGPDSLLQAIAEIVSAGSEETLPIELFREWLTEHSWLLVLDGLDEVPSSGNRDEVLKAIGEFWVDATEAKSDLLMVATTRPQGYSEEFSPTNYRHIVLNTLSPDEALHYGARLAEAKQPANARKQARLVSYLEKAIRTPATRNLMKTPLQVTIMATLIDRGGDPPDQRWKLFAEYYRVIYLRELERGVAANRILSAHQSDIDEIHRRVALVLQVEGEGRSHARALISKERLSEIVMAYLRDEGHADPELSATAAEIVKAATDRLVFLVGIEAEWIGFEIRSLQEFMAAEGLLDGFEADVTERLAAVAGVTSWRNAFLFAAGHIFAKYRHLRPTIYTLCAQLNDPVNDPLAPLLRPGSELAIDLLGDGVATNQPDLLGLLTTEAMRLMECGYAFWRLLPIREGAARETYAEALAKGLDEQGPSRGVSTVLLRELSRLGEEWADRILDERLPASLETVLEVAAWEERLIDVEDEYVVEDPWLANRLDSVTGQMSLAQLDAHRSCVLRHARPQANGALAVVKALNGFSMYGRGDRVPLGGQNASFSIGVRWIEPDLYRDLQPALEGTDPKTLGETRIGALAANAFVFEPTAAELARQLRVLADQVPPSDWRAVAKLTSWPMSTSILHAGDDPKALRRIADLAESGQMGDRSDWEAAEDRWRENGLTLEDLDRVPDVDAPFDAEIAARGLPIDETAGFDQVLGGPPRIANMLLSLLESCDNERSNQVLTKWLVAVLQQQAILGTPPPAAPFCKYLSEEALSSVERVDYGLAVGLEWDAVLSAEEAATLDRIGRRLREPKQGRARDILMIRDNSLPVPLVPDTLIRSWNEGRQSDGLFRILAIGHPVTQIEHPVSEEDLLVEAGEIAARNPGAAGLLTLKGRWTPEVVTDAIAKMASVAAAEPIWLWEAVEYIGERLEEPEAEQALAGLWRAITGPARDSAESLMLRGKLSGLASYLFERRPSNLDRARTWKSLGFFDRPLAEDER